MRVAAALVATVALATVVAACGGSSSTSGTSGHGKHTLVVWQYWSTNGVGLSAVEKRLDQGFEKQYPQYKIDDVAIPFDQLDTKLTAAISAGTGPNLVSVFPGVAGSAFSSGLTPLQSYLTQSDHATWRLLNQAAGPNGNTYSVPWTEYGTFVYYNRKLFKKAGLDPARAPTTWPQFINDCRALKAHGITPLSGGFKDGFLWEWIAFPLMDQLLTPSETKLWFKYDYPITSGPFQDAWSDIKSLSPYFANDAADLDLYEDNYTDFNSGKAAMQFDEPDVNNLIAAQKALGTANVGVFQVPRLTNSAYPAFADAGPNVAWGITKWTSDKTGAWDYIKYLESKQSQDLAWSAGRLVPNNTQSVTPTSNPAIATVLHDLKNPLDHTTYTGFPVSVLAINERYAGEMISGRTSTSSVLKQMEGLRVELRPKFVGTGG